MDKSWMQCGLTDRRYLQGSFEFVNWVREMSPEKTHFLCPCKKCRNSGLPVDIRTMYSHLSAKGIWPLYTVWDKHGEVSHESRIDELGYRSEKAYRDRKYDTEKADKLKRKLEETIQERREVNPDNVASFSFDGQHRLVVYGLGERKGVEIRGFGGQLRRPSKIRGETDISQQYEDISRQYEERTRNAEERAKKAEETAVEARKKIKKLEEEVQALRALFERYTANPQQDQTSGRM